jgi:hypothetical protein
MTLMESEIRSQLERYRDREISLEAFQDWFVPLSWDIEKVGEQTAIQLVHSIEGILGEASSANWDRSELREELTRIVPFVGIAENHVGEPSPLAQLFSFNSTSNQFNTAQMHAGV